MKKIYFLSLTLLMSFFSFGQATDLIISEYAEGTVGNSKYVEIFNGTGTDVDLAGYRIWRITNGGTWPESFIELTGTLANNGTLVLANNATDVPGANIYDTSITWNGDDAVGLAKDIATVWTLIDAIGTDGADPGTGWDVAGVTNATANNKLIRKSTICSPNTDWATSAGTDAASSEWEVVAYTTGAPESGHINSCTTDPTLNITNPVNGVVFNPNTTNVNVELLVNNFAVANGTGDGHIVYSINNGTPVDKFDIADIAVPVTTGQSYTVDLELVDNTGSPLSTPVTATVSFSVADITTLSSIAALRAGIEGNYYELSSEAVVTFTRPSGITTRNQKYIQDNTGAILIDDSADVITDTFNIGDAMVGLKGRLSSFNGVLQFIPLENITPSTATFTITPEVVTIADITANINDYESELVQINGVTFINGDGVATFAASTNYDISDGSTMIFRTLFAEANYVANANLIPSGANDMAVIVAEFNGTPQVVARSLEDVTLSTNSFNAIEGLTMYPNPVSGNVLHFSSTANGNMSVQIFDIVGKEVINAKVINNTINTANLNAGMYIVKITEEGKTATRKLVVK